MKILLKRTRSFILFLIIASSFTVGYTQNPVKKTTYKTEIDIQYRNGEELTEYMLERCKLDIYYPENTDGFSTIVWFHGGGLRAGNKSIPAVLMNLLPETKYVVFSESRDASKMENKDA